MARHNMAFATFRTHYVNGKPSYQCTKYYAQMGDAIAAARFDATCALMCNDTDPNFSVRVEVIALHGGSIVFTEFMRTEG